MRSAIKNPKNSIAKKVIKTIHKHKKKPIQKSTQSKKAKKMSDGLSVAKRVANSAKKWLLDTGKKKLILVEQNCNLGDTLHLTPVIHHYRLKYPDAAIAFIIGQPYHNAHEHNPHIDKLFIAPNLDGKTRIQFRKHFIKFEPDIQIIAPSIFPYGEVWKELAWSYPNIADQYLHNSGIKDLKPLGGKKLIIKTTEDDIKWAKDFLKKHNLKGSKTCILEYTSYSAPVQWNVKKWKIYVDRLKHHGIDCVSVCGPHEGTIPGTISGAGITWRQTAALCSEVAFVTGSGSGITMVAASAKNQPKILEIGISPSVTMEGCGYAPSIGISNLDPMVVADHLYYKIMNG